MPVTSLTPLLVRTCHPAPTVAVTTLSVLLAVSAGHVAGAVVLVCLAVLAGQLCIGWSNDLLDADRDRMVGRADKLLATRTEARRFVWIALTAAAVACAVLSVLTGAWSTVVHLVLVVGSGLAYNVGLKRTWWSWLPYAIAFGALPSVVWLALGPPRAAPLWMMAVGALLGVGAHLLNALPDLDDDAATGVRGLPHRLGPVAVPVVATGVLATASVIAALAPAGGPTSSSWLGLALVVVLGVAALVGRGKTPFRAAMGIAAVNVVLLVVG
ncbi:MAG TPA: UbiA family prenyltransferase [Jiangellaceae bacterium]|nr:UbiA family prenyltransferase [Jiangellaceae bacterium]